jgi:hypothetical protein
MEDRKRNRFLLKSSLSKRLMGRGPINEYSEKLKELKNIAESIDAEGVLLISFLEKSDRYLPVSKAIMDLMSIDNLYTTVKIQRNPALANEFAELMEAVKVINKIIGKRRKERSKSFKQSEEKEEK